MRQGRSARVRVVLLRELASAPPDGYTGTDLWYRLRRRGITCATRVVYEVLDGLIDDGLVHRPTQPGAEAIGGMLNDLLAALEHGEAPTASVSLTVDGYKLTRQVE